MTESKKRVLTEMQQKFLDVLVDEAKGDFKKALELAGYSPTVKVSEVTAALRQEIIDVTMDSIVRAGPKAAAKLTGVLDDPNASGTINTIKVATTILDRMGVVNSPQGGVNLKVPKGGLVILPAKGSCNEPEVESESYDEEDSEE